MNNWEREGAVSARARLVSSAEGYGYLPKYCQSMVVHEEQSNGMNMKSLLLIALSNILMIVSI